MEVNLDLVVQTQENQEMDMQYGLDTLMGASDSVGLIAETILTKHLKKRTHASKVRTRLKGSFKGSYGQKFSIRVEDKALVKRLEKIGRDTFVRAISYIISDALYLNDEKAPPEDIQQLIDELDDNIDNDENNNYTKLIEKLEDPLKRLHYMPTFFQSPVSFRYRKRGELPKELVKFNADTIENITESYTSDNDSIFECIVFRVHNRTGNGRVYIKETEEVVSFSLGSEVGAVRRKQIKKLSQNATDNAELKTENGKTLQLSAKQIRLKSGKLVRLIVSGIV